MALGVAQARAGPVMAARAGGTARAVEVVEVRAAGDTAAGGLNLNRTNNGGGPGNILINFYNATNILVV
mgnify:CR=1 FL=1